MVISPFRGMAPEPSQRVPSICRIDEASDAVSNRWMCDLCYRVLTLCLMRLDSFVEVQPDRTRRSKLLDRDQLETFAAVIEESSFERAAAVLNVTRGAVSQRVKALEESLSSVLVVREKPVVPTAAGEVLLRHVKALRLLEDAAFAQLMPKESNRTSVPIAIAVNADSLATWFPRILWPLLLRRRVAIEIVTDRYRDRHGRSRLHARATGARRGDRVHFNRAAFGDRLCRRSSWSYGVPLLCDA
jgi:hypothetical protein